MKYLEPGYRVSAALSPEQLNELLQQDICTLVNFRNEGEEPEQTPNDVYAQWANDNGIDYHHLPTKPMDYDKALIDKVQALLNDPDRKVHAFCQTGGRATHSWLLAKAREQQAELLLQQCHDMQVQLGEFASRIEEFLAKTQ